MFIFFTEEPSFLKCAGKEGNAENSTLRKDSFIEPAAVKNQGARLVGQVTSNPPIVHGGHPDHPNCPTALHINAPPTLLHTFELTDNNY